MSINDVKHTQRTFPDLVSEHINIKAFTTKASVNMYDAYTAMLHKQAQVFTSNHDTTLSVRALHYSMFNDVNMFMVLRYYLDSVGTWLASSSIGHDYFNVPESVVNAIKVLSPEANATAANAIVKMLDPNFTNIINNVGVMVSEVLRNVFETDVMQTYGVNRSLDNITKIREQTLALVRIYKYWYGLAGTISSLE